MTTALGPLADPTPIVHPPEATGHLGHRIVGFVQGAAAAVWNTACSIANWVKDNALYILGTLAAIGVALWTWNCTSAPQEESVPDQQSQNQLNQINIVRPLGDTDPNDHLVVLDYVDNDRAIAAAMSYNLSPRGQQQTSLLSVEKEPVNQVQNPQRRAKTPPTSHRSHRHRFHQNNLR